MTPDREWYEVIGGLVPADLHQAQVAWRQSPRPSVFAAGNAGDRAAFDERDPARWRVTTEQGDWRYELFPAGYPQLSGGRLGEWSVLRGQTFDDVTVSLAARTLETPSSSTDADLGVVIGWQDDRNYDLALLSASAADNGLWRVQSGIVTALALANQPLLLDQGWHQIAVRRTGDTLTMLHDGLVVAAATTRTPAGLIGVGSRDDRALFDDIIASASLWGAPATVSLASGGRQDLVLDGGLGEASKLYLLAGSATGFSPGFVLHGIAIPLNPDPYLQFVAGNPGALFTANPGQLDASGRGRAAFVLPAGLDPQLAGATLHHAFVTLGSSGVEFASSPVAVRLTP